MALMAAVYWICIRFIFPGYWAPLSPFHIDFYDYTGTSQKSLLDLLTRYPRPVAYIATKFLGLRGVSVLIAGAILIALTNLLLTAFAVKRTFRLTYADMAAPFVAWLLLLFAHPYFYFEHRYDVPAQVSYFFLMASFCAWLLWRDAGSRTARAALIAAALVSAVLFAFAKETYFVSALLLVLALAITDTRRMRWHAAFGAWLAIAEAASFLWSRHVGGPFVNPTADPHSDYHISLAPASLFNTGQFYFDELFNIPLVILCVALVVAAVHRREQLLLTLGWMAAGLAAFAPLDALPNHKVEQYSWVALPMLLAPLLAAAPVPGAARASVARLWLLAAFTAAVIASPLGYRDQSAAKTPQWLIGQDHFGAAMEKSFAAFRSLPRPSHVLVAGLEDPATPWQFPSFVQQEFGRQMYWTVLVTPAATLRRQSRLVGFAEPEDVRLTDFDYIARYRADGSLINVLPARALANEPRIQVLVPELAPLMASAQQHPMIAEWWLHCAYQAAQWGLWDPAADFLARAKVAGGEKNHVYKEVLSAIRNRPERTPVTVEFGARPSHVVQRDGSGVGSTELYWHISGRRDIEIHVNAPNGSLFASGHSSGAQRTGKWVTNGMRFYLQDVSGGKPLTPENTLASVTVEVTR
jgi:hypothetical protein